MKTARVKGNSGAVHDVPAFGTFSQFVQGERFEFVITQDLGGTGYNVTQLSSGLRVCTVHNEHGESLNVQAQDSLALLIERVGEARVRSILAGARDLPPAEALDAASRAIYRRTLEAMQDAEEMGGPDDARDYVKLMEAIAAEATRRAGVCRENFPDFFPLPRS